MNDRRAGTPRGPRETITEFSNVFPDGPSRRKECRQPRRRPRPPEGAMDRMPAPGKRLPGLTNFSENGGIKQPRNWS